MTTYAPEEQKTTRSTATTESAKHAKRTLGEDPAPAPGHSTKHLPNDFRTINGWGADLDVKNRPMIPMELPSDVKTVRGDVKHRQQPEHKIFMSNEQPDLTPVFGTSCPPHGLSGMLREYAYQFGEGTNRHWMTLLLADRVDVWGSAITDALRGRPDNWIAEKGWGVRMKYSTADPEKRQRNFVVAGSLILGAIALGMMLDRRR